MIGGDILTDAVLENSAETSLPDAEPDNPKLEPLPERRDFADSAFWTAKLRSNPQGKAVAEFKLPDSLTGWHVVVTDVSKDLHVGQQTTRFQTRKSLMVKPILPRILVEGDRITISAVVVNSTPVKQTARVTFALENGEILTDKNLQIDLEPNSQRTVSWKVKAGKPGKAKFQIQAVCPGGNDSLSIDVPVQHVAGEQIVTWSGTGKEIAALHLPDGVDPKTATLEIIFAPSLTADMIDTLDYLVEYPYGCVEQTMSRFLPAVKVAQILKIKKINHPGLMQKLRGVTSAGIKRLLELQQADGGWGWQNSSQTHEMMTPYALYGLIEAEKAGYTIPDPQAIPRGLARLRSFIAAKAITNTMDQVYCMYVFGRHENLDADWWNDIQQEADNNRLSDHALALALELAIRHSKKELADLLAKQLRARGVEANSGITWNTGGFSRWANDRYEITAAAMKALVAYDRNDPRIGKALAFFAATKHGNRWNSTKDTAMIIFAMADYLEKQQDDGAAVAKLSVQCNRGERIKLAIGDASKPVKIQIPSKDLIAGNNRLEFTDAPAKILVRAVLRYRQPGKELIPIDLGLKVTRTVSEIDTQGKIVRILKPGDVVAKGSYLVCDVVVSSAQQTTLRYVLVSSPTPAGCELLPQDDPRFKVSSATRAFREDREGKALFHHEQVMNEFHNKSVWHVEMTGKFHLPAARAEMLYQSEIIGQGTSAQLEVE